MRQPTRVSALLLLLSLALPACDSGSRRAPIAPEPSIAANPSSTVAPAIEPGGADRGFFPAYEGNTWHYVGSWRLHSVINGVESDTSGGGPYDVVATQVYTQDHSTSFYLYRAGEISFSFRIYRQDARGLYYVEYFRGASAAADAPRADLPNWPPAIPIDRGGPRPGETIVLLYPPGVASRWSNGASTSVVEAEETLTLPFGRVRAFRVRSGSPQDYTIQWMSTCGIMRTIRHQEVPLRDALGTAIIGTRIYDSFDEATGIDLPGCGLCTRCR